MILRPIDRRLADRRGFTLMEVLVVVAILVVLAGVSSVFVFRYLDDAKRQRVQADLSTLTKACQAYKLRYDDYPASLDMLLAPPSGQPFLESQENILDPWGHKYRYDPNGPNQNALKPDISTVTPQNETIGNWMGSRPNQ